MLTDRELAVLKLRKEGRTQQEIAKILKITQPAVSNFERNAQRKIADANQLLETLKKAGLLVLGLLFLPLLAMHASAATPNPGHAASSIGSGTFTNGAYTFPQNLTVNGTLFFIDSANTRIGIGTSSPTSRLSVAGGSIFHNASGNPSIVGNYDTPGTALDVKVQGKYAYVADHSGGLQIVDIANKSTPIRIGNISTDQAYRGIYIAGSYVYAADYSNGLQIIDITNPTAPQVIGTYDTPGLAYGVYVDGRYAYVADWGSGLQIIDVSNPRAPTRVGNYDTAGSAARVYVRWPFAYVADDTSLSVINITTPSAPTLAGSLNTPGAANGVYVSGSYAYVADDTSGLSIVNITKPSTPTLAGQYDTSGNAYDVVVAGKYAYVADYASGLHVINIANSSSPTLVGTYDTSGFAFAVAVSGQYAYVADYAVGGLQIIKLNGLETPAIETGAVETGLLTVQQDASVAGSLSVGSGLVVGADGISSQGRIAVFNTSTLRGAVAIGSENTSFATLYLNGSLLLQNTSGAVIINATDTASGVLRFGSTTSNISIRVNGTIDATGAITGLSGFDVAEKFSATEPMGPGDLVAIAGKDSVKKATKTDADLVIGAVSTQPSFIVGGPQLQNPILIGLVGRIPIKVTGPVQAGDFITISDTPGVGERATTAGYVIGRALEPNVNGVVTIIIQPYYFNPAVKADGTIVGGNDAKKEYSDESAVGEAVRSGKLSDLVETSSTLPTPNSNTAQNNNTNQTNNATAPPNTIQTNIIIPQQGKDVVVVIG